MFALLLATVIWFALGAGFMSDEDNQSLALICWCMGVATLMTAFA